MNSTITVNNKTSDAPVISLSDNDTDRFLKLITVCAKTGEMTGTQLEIIEYLDDLRYKKGYDPGNVSFDIGDMPWNACSIEDDKKYLQDLLVKVKETEGSEDVWPWLDTLSQMIGMFDPDSSGRKYDADEYKAKLRFKKDLGWKACFDTGRNLYTAERSWRGFYQLCEIDKETYGKLCSAGSSEDPDKLIRNGRVLFEADDDYYTMPYCIVKDENYNELAPWSRAKARYERTYNGS